MNVKRQRSNVHVGVGWIVLIIGLSAASIAVADLGPDFAINAFMNETQKQTPDPDRITMVWWLPDEFWEWSLSQDDTITAEGAEEILSVLRPYVLLAVVDGTLGPLGGVTFVPPAEVRANVVFVDATGRRLKPLADSSVSPDARNLAVMMKPVIASIAGPVGENLTFVFFPAANSDGTSNASATTEGSFSVEVGDEQFEWKTPLGSVLPPKVCPVDNEQMSGAWFYCPWHGKKLGTKARNSKTK